MGTTPVATDTQGSTALGDGTATSTAPPPASSPPAPAVVVKTIHPALTIKGALSTLTGLLTIASAMGAVAVNIAAGLHVGWISANITYAMDAETIAMAGVHTASIYFTST